MRLFNRHDMQVYETARFYSKAEARAALKAHLDKFGAIGDYGIVFERLWQSARHLKNAIDRWKWDNYNRDYGPDYLRD